MKNENDELTKTSDFYAGISDVRETSRVTHQALYDDMLVALMERAMELEKLVASQEDQLDKLIKDVPVLEKKLRVIIILLWLLLAVSFIFLTIAVS